jgi:hypothetical protein
MATRGRPPGGQWRDPANLAAHHANVLLELWLADSPAFEIALMCPGMERLIEECWSQRGDKRRYTVPKKTARGLCRIAIAHVTKLYRLNDVPDLNKVLGIVSRRAPPVTMRRKRAARRMLRR